jgi:Domain of unknown function (DUF1841)
VSYDPSTQPRALDWLALDEQERIAQVLAYHQRAKVPLPNARVHAAMHVAVENQLAEEYPAAVATLERLVIEGLQRHEAIHAIASVLARQMHELLQTRKLFDPALYERELNALSARSWMKGSG